ncbi:hypothetical protein LSH36_2423g00002 [Paralvinella palmiformis]|uniref:C-type lectin domain-containing protein n=1 Tax=Paralvinella palmiformis TaxID=53620 RepID=A0AAD9MKK4_9ANNE|nr:hypothetical protein LSH36_2423g00002 [Paralvinella palmiformis]
MLEAFCYEKDHGLLENVAGDFRIWLGMRKPVNFSDVYDFRYYSDGMPIKFEYWLSDSPNNENNHENCVLTKPEYDHRWKDVSCTLSRNLICQL